jgi:hypothetical protein
MLPRIFIGSSAESLPAAKALKLHLAPVADVALWAEDVFHPTDYTLDALIRESDRSDLAVLLFTPDDLSAIRDAVKDSVRDNVIFEYGLFAGRLGRLRCYFVIPERAPDLRIPTDLAGITALTYSPAVFRADQATAFQGVGETLRKAISDQATGGGARRSLSGAWSQSWSVTGSVNYSEENRSSADVIHVGDHIRAQWTSSGEAFVLEGRVDSRIITGSWRNLLEGGGYTGAFQLSVSTNGKSMSGKWLGHRENMTSVESGDWKWERA